MLQIKYFSSCFYQPCCKGHGFSFRIKMLQPKRLQGMQCIQKCWFAAAKNIIQYFFKIVKWNFLKNYKNRTK